MFYLLILAILGVVLASAYALYQRLPRRQDGNLASSFRYFSGPFLFGIIGLIVNIFLASIVDILRADQSDGMGILAIMAFVMFIYVIGNVVISLLIGLTSQSPIQWRKRHITLFVGNILMSVLLIVINL